MPDDEMDLDARYQALKSTPAIDPREYDKPAPEGIDERYHALKTGIPAAWSPMDRLRSAREKFSDTDEPTARRIGSRLIPYFSAGMQTVNELEYAQHLKNIEAGRAQDWEYDAAAFHERMKEVAAKRGIGGKAVDVALNIPAIYGEGFGASKILGGATTRFAAPTIMGAATRLATRGAPRLAAQTALMPSMYAPQAAERATHSGGWITDPENIGPSGAYGAAQVLVLGRLGKPVPGIPTIAGRLAARTGLGMVEQQAVDLASGLLDEILPEAYKVNTGYGLIGDVVKAAQGKKSWEEVGTHAGVQALTFALFSAMHIPGDRAARKQMALESMADMADIGQTMRKRGFREPEAARVMAETAQRIGSVQTKEQAQAALEQTPFFIRGQAEKMLNRFLEAKLEQQAAEKPPEPAQEPPKQPLPGVQPLEATQTPPAASSVVPGAGKAVPQQATDLSKLSRPELIKYAMQIGVPGIKGGSMMTADTIRQKIGAYEAGLRESKLVTGEQEIDQYTQSLIDRSKVGPQNKQIIEGFLRGDSIQTIAGMVGIDPKMKGSVTSRAEVIWKRMKALDTEGRLAETYQKQIERAVDADLDAYESKEPVNQAEGRAVVETGFEHVDFLDALENMAYGELKEHAQRSGISKGQLADILESRLGREHPKSQDARREAGAGEVQDAARREEVPDARPIQEARPEVPGPQAEVKAGAAEQAMAEADRAAMAAQPKNVAYSGVPIPSLSPLERARVDRIPDAIKSDNPQVEARLQKAHGIEPVTLWQKIKNVASAAYRGFTRAEAHLPKTGEYDSAREGFRLLKTVPDSSSDHVSRTVAAIIDPLGPKQLALFERALIVENQLASIERSEPLRFGFKNQAEVEAYRNKLAALVAQTPEVQRALATREAIRKEVVQEAVEFGVLGEEALNNTAYYHQMVNSMMDATRYKGGSIPLRIKRSFQKARATGDTLPEQYDYNTSYVEAEARWMTEMRMEIGKEKLLREHIQKPYDIIEQLKQDARDSGETANAWQKQLPRYPNHEVWSPEPGNLFYRANTIPEKIVAEFTRAMFDGAEARAEITPEDVRTALAMGGMRRPMVLPKPLVAQLKETLRPKPEGVVSDASRSLMGAWKVWTLLSPKRAISYMFRNLTGDIEPIITAEPGALKQVPRATHELWRFFRGDLKISPEVKSARDLGVINSSLTAQEIPDVKDLPVFRRLYEKPGLWKAILDLPAAYMEKAKRFNEFRESIGRYAAFLHYKGKLESGESFNYGGARKSTVDNIRARHGNDVVAAHLARNLLGDYGNLTQFGNWMRKHAAPFWSWTEVNFKRWPRMTENIAREGWSGVARGTAVKSGAFAAAAILRLAGAYGVLWAWNNLVQGDNEKDLSPQDRASPHITLGRTEDGDVRVFRRVGSLGDFAEWFGVTELMENLPGYRAGRLTETDLAGEMAKEPLNKLVQSVRPDVKTAGEVLTGQSTFPDVTQPHAARRDEIMANTLGVRDELRIGKRALGVGDEPKPGYWNRFFGIATAEPHIEEFYKRLKELERMEDRKDSKLSKDELRRFRRAQDDIAELNHAIRGEHKNRSGKYEKTKEPTPEQIEQFRRKRIEIAGKALSGKKPALAK